MSGRAATANARIATANVSAELGIGEDVASLTAEAGSGAATSLEGVAGAAAGSSSAAQAKSATAALPYHAFVVETERDNKSRAPSRPDNVSREA